MAFTYPPGFDPQPTLSSERFLLRPLREADRSTLSAAASDPLIWAGHPSTDRYKPEVFSSYFDLLLGSNACLLFTDRKRPEAVIGCSVFYTDTNAPSRLSIGFTFLTRAYWGGTANRAIKGLMLSHIFQASSEAWFHIAPENLRSQAATQKLGARLTHTSEIDLGGGAQLWQCYCLTREAWKKAQPAPC